MHKCVFFTKLLRPETRRVSGTKIANEINELKKSAIFLGGADFYQVLVFISTSVWPCGILTTKNSASVNVQSVLTPILLPE